MAPNEITSERGSSDEMQAAPLSVPPSADRWTVSQIFHRLEGEEEKRIAVDPYQVPVTDVSQD
jgi:hypothetical protein